ncbi:hypothetical protein DL770_008913 [Monosporascus sp. CRB-9-2]|nr:hypothetical protein DL770_008913 [Monosporascus sp. CRB-9-2]
MGLFRDELDSLLSHLGLKERPIDVYGHSWGGMLVAVWAVAPPSSAKFRGLVISNSLASMDPGRVEINKLRAWLPENVREMLNRAEKDKNFGSPECESAVKVFYERHLQPCETMAVCGGHSCPRLVREGRDHLMYNA